MIKDCDEKFEMEGKYRETFQKKVELFQMNLKNLLIEGNEK